MGLYSNDNFNSHAHVERDDFLWNADETKFHFNSHAHVERDEMGLGKISDIKHFNSHAHVERDIVNPDMTIKQLNFNSHAHVERDYHSLKTECQSKISTHTLTWSVTLDVVYIWCLLNVMRTYFFI